MFCTGLWFSYEFYLFEAINDYQKEQIEKKLISNFEENPDAFKKIDLIKPALGKIYELEFRKNQDYIQFQIQSDSLAIRHTGAQLINIGNSEGPAWEFVELKKDNSILVSLEGNLTLIEKRWVIHFAGPRSHPNLKDILALQNINLKDLDLLEEIINETHCLAFEKNDSIIKLRFAGHLLDSFNYAFLLGNQKPNSNWKKLSEPWFHFYYQSGLYCGFTDW